MRLRAPCQLPRTPYGEQALRKILRGCHPKFPFSACGRRATLGGIEGLITLQDAASMAQAENDDYVECEGASSLPSGSTSISIALKGKENKDLKEKDSSSTVRPSRSRGSGPCDTALQEGGAADTFGLGGCGTEAGAGSHSATPSEPPVKGTTPGRGGRWAELLARIRATEAKAKMANEA